MDLRARRSFRLAGTVALSLAGAYGMDLPLPFLAPLFAFLMGATPKPPPGPKGLLVLILVLWITLGIGLVLVPLLQHYGIAALMVVALSLYLAVHLTVDLGKTVSGTLSIVGITTISAAGTASAALALLVIQSLVLGVCLVTLCQWILYPLFPEDPAPEQAPDRSAGPTTAPASNALRTTLIVFPSYLLALTNPAAYLPLIMKAVSLGQQGSVTEARHAGAELLGSTFLAGCFAIVLWSGLKLCPSLWMFFLWILLFALYVAAKLNGVFASRYPPSFWLNVATTLLILLGPAVEDSANGKDVAAAFAVRMGLFIAVTLYAWLAIHLLERLRGRSSHAPPETAPC